MILPKTLVWSLVLSLVALGSTPAPGRASTIRATQETSPDTAVLSLQNRPIFVFRAPVAGLSPVERARRAQARLNAVVHMMTPDSVTTLPTSRGTLIVLGTNPIFMIMTADVDTLTGETVQGAEDQVVTALRAAITARIEDRSVPALIRGALRSLVATVVFLILLWLLNRVWRTIAARSQSLAARGLGSLSLGGFRLFQPEAGFRFLHWALRIVLWLVALFLAEVWLTFALHQFAYTDPWGAALRGFLLSTLAQFALAMLGAVPGLFVVILIFILTRLGARLIASFFDAVEAGTVALPWLHPEIVAPTRRIVTGLLWVFAIVAAFPYLPGSDSDVFKGISVFIGLIVSIGSSGITNQALSGLAIMYSRALRPGDYVRIGETEGTVVELGLLSTRIRTPWREVVTIPSSVVVGTQTVNYSRLAASEGVFLRSSVTIGYDAPWRQVHAMLLRAAERTEGLLQEPLPFVLQTALGDFYVEYQLNARLDDPTRMVNVRAALHANIQDEFNEHGVQIMSPHFMAQPEGPVVVPKHRWFEPPAKQEGKS